MSKRKVDVGEAEIVVGRIKPATNIIWSVIMGLFALLFVIPILFVYVIAFTDEQSLIENGFSFFPSAFSVSGFQYLFASAKQVISSFAVSIFMTVVGTLLSLFVMAMLAYVLSRKDYHARRALTFLVLFTMLFNGGLVPTYMVTVNVLKLYNNLWVLVLPALVNGFSVIVLRTFYRSISPSLIEAAKIDGAGEFKIFLRIIVPLSKPGLATIALLSMIGYWNEWFQGLLYIQDSLKQPLQTFLWSMQASIDILNQSMDMSRGNITDLLASPPTESTRMAMTALVITPILFAYPFFQRYFVRGLTIGGVKE